MIIELLMKKRGLLFIVPPSLPIEDLRVTDNDHKGFGYITSSIPMGVLSLSSYVRKHTDTNVLVLDMNTHIRDEMKTTDTWEDFFRKVLTEKTKNQKIDLIGISAIFNVCAGYMESITNISKEVCNNPIVIAGGGLPSNLPEQVYDLAPEIDAIAYSEGEKPLVRLLKSGKNKSNISKDPDILATQNSLSEKIGMRVYLNNKKNNSGTLTFEYKAVDQLDRLINIIKSNY